MAVAQSDALDALGFILARSPQYMDQCQVVKDYILSISVIEPVADPDQSASTDGTAVQTLA